MSWIRLGDSLHRRLSSERTATISLIDWAWEVKEIIPKGDAYFTKVIAKGAANSLYQAKRLCARHIPETTCSVCGRASYNPDPYHLDQCQACVKKRAERIDELMKRL